MDIPFSRTRRTRSTYIGPRGLGSSSQSGCAFQPCAENEPLAYRAPRSSAASLTTVPFGTREPARGTCSWTTASKPSRIGQPRAVGPAGRTDAARPRRAHAVRRGRAQRCLRSRAEVDRTANDARGEDRVNGPARRSRSVARAIGFPGQWRRSPTFRQLQQATRRDGQRSSLASVSRPGRLRVVRPGGHALPLAAVALSDDDETLRPAAKRAAVQLAQERCAPRRVTICRGRLTDVAPSGLFIPERSSSTRAHR